MRSNCAFQAFLGYEKVAMGAAVAMTREMGFSTDRIDDLKTAISEACLNAIEHGNRLQAGVQVLVTFTGQPSGLQIAPGGSGGGVGNRGGP